MDDDYYDKPFVWDRGDIPRPAESCALHRFVFPRALSLVNLPIVGKGECVELIQHYVIGVGHTSTWEFEEESIVDLFKKHFEPGFDITKYPTVGTVIGNKLPNGKWPGKPHGNHVCFLHLHGPWKMPEHELVSFTVIEQFRANGATTILFRTLKRKGKGPDGNFIDPPNNADAFFPLKRVIK
jgi:hypothetical protein